MTVTDKQFRESYKVVPWTLESRIQILLIILIRVIIETVWGVSVFLVFPRAALFNKPSISTKGGKN